MSGCITPEPAAESGMRSGKMITRLDIYIFRQVLFALVVATGGLTALIWLTQSLRFVDLVVNRGLSFLVFLHLTGLLIPSFVAVILPITTYVVIQFVYQRMATRPGTDGDARRRPVALGAGASGAGGGTAGHGRSATRSASGLVPGSAGRLQQFQWEIRNRLAAFLLQDGVFTPMSDKLTVYVRSRDPDGTLRGILVDDARDPDRPRHHPGRARPADGRAERAAGAAAGRQPAGDRPPDRPAGHADLQAERNRPGRRHQGRGRRVRPTCRRSASASCCIPHPAFARDRAEMDRRGA